MTRCAHGRPVFFYCRVMKMNVIGCRELSLSKIYLGNGARETWFLRITFMNTYTLYWCHC